MIKSISIDRVIHDLFKQHSVDPFSVFEEAAQGDGRFSIGRGDSAHIKKLSMMRDAPRLDGAITVVENHAYFDRIMANLCYDESVRLLYSAPHSLQGEDPIVNGGEATLEIRGGPIPLTLRIRKGGDINRVVKLPSLDRVGAVHSTLFAKAIPSEKVRASVHVLLQPVWDKLKR